MEKIKCPCCNENLIKDNNVYRCLNKHSFDISKNGYCNLLLANQKHSSDPGDSKEMIKSRVDFLMLDYYRPLRSKIIEIINNYSNYNISFCDLACGEGYYTNYIHEVLSKNHNVETIGVDISKYAIIEACKKAKDLNNISYFIGNLMNLPFNNDSFDFMLNCFALLDNKEFNRVLKTNGYFIRVLPGQYHLYELKGVLYDNVKLNIKKDEKLDGFELVNVYKVKDKITLKSKKEIHDLFTMTPYYYKSSFRSIDKLFSLDILETQIEFDLYLYKKINNL